MTIKEIQDLLKLITKLELSEFKLREADFELQVRTKHYEKNRTQTIQTLSPAPAVIPPAVPAAPAPASGTPAKAGAPTPQQLSPSENAGGEANGGDDDSRYLKVTSPIVGTFYRSPSPEKPAYVKVGDTIAKGDVVCIVEAMKLFNEIESEVSGKVVKVLVEDASPVEYEQPLFLVDPKE